MACVGVIPVKVFWAERFAQPDPNKMNSNAEAILFFMNMQYIGLGWVAQNFSTKKPRDSGAFLIFFNNLNQQYLNILPP
jgi:hypothetical protein